MGEPYREKNRANRAKMADLTHILGKENCMPPLAARDDRGRLAVVAGSRRAQALKNIGVEQIPVYVAHDLDGMRAWLALDLREPGRSPLALMEAARFMEKAVKLLGLRARQAGLLALDVADDNKIERSPLSNARSMLRRLESARSAGDQEEVEALTADTEIVIRGGMSVSTALSRSTERRAARERAAKALPASDQERLLEKAIQTLLGVTDSLTNMGPLSPDVNPERLAVWERELRAVHSRIYKTIKEISQGERAA